MLPEFFSPHLCKHQRRKGGPPAITDDWRNIAITLKIPGTSETKKRTVAGTLVDGSFPASGQFGAFEIPLAPDREQSSCAVIYLLALLLEFTADKTGKGASATQPTEVPVLHI